MTEAAPRIAFLDDNGAVQYVAEVRRLGTSDRYRISAPGIIPATDLTLDQVAADPHLAFLDDQGEIVRAADPTGGEQTTGRTARMAIPVELATVERLDRIVETVKAERGGSEREAGDLDSYSAVIDWATDCAINEGTAEQWARAGREAYHHAATLGALVLIEVDAFVVRSLDGALAAAQGTVTYAPTYATAISWFLNVARWAGHPAPGED